MSRKTKQKPLMTDGRASFWICFYCRETNHAPANQEPYNRIICQECEKEIRWSELTPELLIK